MNADERRSIGFALPSTCWVPSLRSPTPWAPDFSRKSTSGPCSENSAFAASALSPKLHSQSTTKATLPESTLQISSSKTLGKAFALERCDVAHQHQRRTFTLDLARVNPALDEDHLVAGLGRGLRRDLSGMFVLWGTLDGYVLFQRW